MRCRRAAIESAVLLLALLAVACSPEPSVVFVPGPSFRQSVDLATAQGDHATVEVDEPLVLHAQRSSGPWVEVARDSLAPDACWLRSPPDAVEPEVAGNLRWIVEPTGAASFNVELRRDFTREVRFSEAGTYRLSTEGGAWCGGAHSANTLVVDVVNP